jgi:hypothetical protein
MGYHRANEELLIVDVANRWYRLVPVALDWDTMAYSHYDLLSDSVQVFTEK